MSEILYKYLDATGGLIMLYYGTLQFTNATQLNVPSLEYKHLLPNQNDDNGPIEWKKVRAFLEIGGECFESVRLGINISKEDKEKIMKVARERNPEIKIHQMTIDPDAFKLKAELIND